MNLSISDIALCVIAGCVFVALVSHWGLG